MSVLKNLQNLSDLEFYKCAEKLQDDITDFALRNFGLKRSPRSVNQIIKDIEEADQETINGIFAKYGRKPNQGFNSEFPEWFIENRKLHLIAFTDTLIENIIAANIIHPVTIAECDQRRCLQDAAIGVCGNLIKYNAYKSVRSTDALYKFLFGGQKWENPKNRKSTVKESKAK